MILFFDTETTGLPKYKIHPGDPSQPGVLQLAAILSDDDGEIVDTYSTLVHIGSKPIHPMAFAAHGITSEKANTEGIPPMEALVAFHSLTLDAEFLVCHNFDFDFKLIELLAHYANSLGAKEDEPLLVFSDISELPYKCTMRSTIQYCALPFPSGRRGHKFPKLEELYFILFNEKLEGSHDALNDVMATHRCYFELKRREIL